MAHEIEMKMPTRSDNYARAVCSDCGIVGFVKDWHWNDAGEVDKSKFTAWCDGSPDDEDRRAVVDSYADGARHIYERHQRDLAKRGAAGGTEPGSSSTTRTSAQPTARRRTPASQRIVKQLPPAPSTKDDTASSSSTPLPWEMLRDLAVQAAVKTILDLVDGETHGQRQRDLKALALIDDIGVELRAVAGRRALAALDAGRSVSDVARALGVSRQAAHKRFVASA